MKNKKLNLKIVNFEKITESNGKKIIGGFSQSVFISDPTSFDDGSTNNCQGGNCTRDCGHGQNIQCNTQSGCGN